MPDMKDRASGFVDKAAGMAKEYIGERLGDREKQAEGRSQQQKGEAKEAAAKGSERIEAEGEQLGGGITEKAGEVLGNEQMKVEGTAKKLKGEGREALNR